jgi:hypothetical protein
MSGGELIGDIAQGALVARAVEPGHGEGGTGHESVCLNCETPLIGSHCYNCGQAAHIHKTVAAFFHDLLHGVFHFEGKIWRTLPMLVWQPGRLTREYIDGRRASYVSPIALFLFCVFLMFAVVKQFAGEFDPGNVVKVNGVSVNEGMPIATRHLTALKTERARLTQSGQPTDEIDGKIEGQEQALNIMREAMQAKSDESIVSSDIPAIKHALKVFRANPSLAIYKLQNNAYKYSWGLIPLSVPFVWLLFPFSRRFKLYDHTVFVTYSLCFMTLLAVFLTLAIAVGAPLITAMAMLVPPWHMYRQLRGSYGLDRIGAMWRTITLACIAFTVLLAFLILILMETGA